MKRSLFSIILVGLLAVMANDAAAQKRQAIAACWSAGAFNQQMMYQCSGLNVPTPVFQSCMTGGACFDEPPLGISQPLPPPLPPGAPFCGAMGYAYCPAPSPCGFPNTIACPPPPGYPFPPFIVAPGCGVAGLPPCALAQPCGAPTTFACPHPQIVQAPIPAPPIFVRVPREQIGGFGWKPRVQIVVPAPAQGDGQFGTTISMARPPIPNLEVAEKCYDEAQDEEQMYQCLVNRALPKAYRTTVTCMDEHPDDAGAAAVCSIGDENLEKSYRKMRRVQECSKNHNTQEDIALCAGREFLGENELYYAKCLKQNKTDYGAAAACGLAKDLTPEQQIAVSCAVKTGGNPKLFLACTGGQLLARELDKCWEHGVATNDGCFGPNNDIRKFVDQIDGSMRTALGENSEVYKAYKLYKDNVLLPGPNHEVVKAFNTALGDVRNGMGENNDLVKAGKAIGSVLPSVSLSIPIKF
ncbi:hypothetical protein [Pseudomonas tructae]|uniref:hypothetical protein n=1 Tax=Pseudomonas tructae TaxID=2518644 RepID=UPI0013EED9FD|nr:hypothetical protein [Pseudomonas tructae]